MNNHRMNSAKPGAERGTLEAPAELQRVGCVPTPGTLPELEVSIVHLTNQIDELAGATYQLLELMGAADQGAPECQADPPPPCSRFESLQRRVVDLSAAVRASLNRIYQATALLGGE